MLGLGNSLTSSGKSRLYTGVQFDRDSSQYINVGDDNSLSFGTGSADVAMSISMWVNVDLAGSDQDNEIGLMVKGDEYNFYISNQYNRVVFIREDASASGYLREISATNSVTSDTWTHIVVTSDDSEYHTGLNIYIDNAISTITSVASSYTASENTSSDLRIGAGISGAGGASDSSGAGANGAANTGTGGSGGSADNTAAGGTGGSGIVVLRYKFQ